MKERVKELRAAGRRGAQADPVEGESAVLAKLAEMPEPDRAIGERVHAIVRATAPGLLPRTWYGMPAYADANGNIVCHFQGAYKFKARYATIGFSDKARLDESDLWPVAFALNRMSPAVEARVAELVKRAVGSKP